MLLDFGSFFRWICRKSQNFLTELERHGMSLIRFLVTEEYKLFQEEYENVRDWTTDPSIEVSVEGEQI